MTVRFFSLTVFYKNFFSSSEKFFLLACLIGVFGMLWRVEPVVTVQFAYSNHAVDTPLLRRIHPLTRYSINPQGSACHNRPIVI